MNSFISMDGQKVQVMKGIDLNGDGVVSPIEILQRQGFPGEQSIVHPGELSESLKELNKDNLDPITNMSDVDMRSRLHQVEVPSLLAVDSLVALKFLPPSCLAFSRQKKRLNISLKGLGRTEMVDITIGKREHDTKKQGFFGRLFNPGGGEQQ